MKATLHIPAALALAICLATAPIARGDDVKICVCDPMAVLKQMQEFKDLQTKTKADQQTVMAQVKQKQDDIKAKQEALNLLLPDSQQYAQQNQELLKASIDYKVFGELTQANFVREEKNHLKALFDKIQATAGKVAQAKGYNLVISSHQPEIDNIDQIDVQNLTAALLIQRVVLYNDPKLDITEDVLVSLDKDYNASGGVATPPSSTSTPPSGTPAPPAK